MGRWERGVPDPRSAPASAQPSDVILNSIQDPCLSVGAIARPPGRNAVCPPICFCMSSSYVYILASSRRGTIYVGVTTHLARRVREHRNGLGSRFTKRYDVTRLVHVETYDGVEFAIAREKQLKAWRRAWKIELIERDNPDWVDIYPRLNW